VKTSFWLSNHFKPLIYIGDAYTRANVSPVRLIGSLSNLKIERFGLSYGTQQFFRWPDGSEHCVPPHCVVEDTPKIRKQKGLS
jgi:hypothetical protein